MIRTAHTLLLTLALLAPAASAQTAPAQTPPAAPAQPANPAAAPTLPQALALAYRQGPDLATAQTTLQDAQTALAARRADPSTLVPDLQGAQNAADLAAVQIGGTRLSVMQNVVNAYLALYETQQNVALLRAQAALDTRNLTVAQQRLAVRSGTSLDVSRAQNTLNTTNQNLANATAQLPVRANELARLFGQSSGQITAAAPPAPPALTAALAGLGTNLEARLPNVVQARQNVATAELNVRLSDNDYTPRRTLETARANLDNAQRTLANVQKTSATSLNDAYRAAQDAFTRIGIENEAVGNARTALEQARVRLASGLISAVELQTSEVALQNAQYALTQATDAYWRALAALSVAAGQDVTGLVAPALPAQ